MQQTRGERKGGSMGRIAPKFKYSQTFNPVYQPDRTRVSYQTQNPAGLKINDDLDWLQKLVHGFQCYRGHKKNQVTHKIQRQSGVEGSKEKIGIPEKHHSYSQRKILSDSANNPAKQKQRKSNLVKQLPKKANNIEIQNSFCNKGMNIELVKTKPKQKLHMDNFHKERAKDNTKVSQFISVGDEKDVKVIHKYSFNENKVRTSYGKKAVNVRVDRRDFIDAVTTKKSCGKIIKNKFLEVEEKCNKKNILEQKSDCNAKLKCQTFLQQEQQSKFNSIKLKELRNSRPIESPKYASLIGESNKQIQKTELIELVKQSNNKKMKLALENDKGRYVGIKKQRKLNLSFGERKNNQTEISNYFLTSISHKDQNFSKLGGEKLCCSVILTKNDQTPQICQQNQQRSIPYICQPSKTTVFANHNIKCVESTKNSQVFTEHSIVQQKSQFNKSQKMKVNEEADILSIFNKLDCRKLGYLTAQNCSIENVSQEIRYILGAVLERVVSGNIRYDFNLFIKLVQGTLEKVDYQIQETSKNNNPFSVKADNKIVLSRPLEVSHSKSDRREVQSEELCLKGQVKKIRYTTFQDSQRQRKEVLLQNNKQTEYQTNYQQRFENKIKALSYFRSEVPKRKQTPAHDQQAYCSVSKLRLQNSRQNYKNQIVQLEQLNKRLENYMSGQNFNESSDPKLNMRNA